MIKRFLLIMMMLLLLLASGGCSDLTIETSQRFPAQKFSAAEQKIASLQKANPHRQGVASQLRVLYYSGEDKQVIGFTVTREASRGVNPKNFKPAKSAGTFTKNMDELKMENLEDIFTLGPGLVFKARVRDDQVNVLMWLE